MERVNSGQHPWWLAVFFLSCLFWSFWESPALGVGYLGVKGGMGWQGRGALLVQAHGRALVHAHVGVTQQASGLALDALWIQSVQLLWGHFQVGPHLWTG